MSIQFKHDDNSVDVLKVEEKDGDLVATVVCWTQVKINGGFYTSQKTMEMKLELQKGPAPS